MRLKTLIYIIVTITIVSLSSFFLYNKYYDVGFNNDKYEVSLSEKNIVLSVNESYKLNVSISSNNIYNVNFIWISSNTNVVTVDNSGNVVAKGSGTATITVKTDNDKSATCSVTVKDNIVYIDNITLNKSSITIIYGSIETLLAQISPSNATESVTWSSSNNKVATVNNGVITAEGKGTATITVSSSSGKKQTCLVTVNPYIKEDGYPYIYRDESADLTIEKKQYNSTLTGYKTNYYQVHLKLSDYSRLHTGLTKTQTNSSGQYLSQEISKTASAIGAILALEGDQAVNDTKGVVRDGGFYSGKGNNPNNISANICVGYYNKYTGVMDKCDKLTSSTIAEAINTRELTDTFNFGPYYLENGQIRSGIVQNANERPRQRNTLGYVKPGEYYFIVSEGIAYTNTAGMPVQTTWFSDGESYGLTNWEIVQLLKSLGCTYGLPLDGGGSIIVWFKGKQLQSKVITTVERDYLTDFIYFK